MFTIGKTKAWPSNGRVQTLIPELCADRAGEQSAELGCIAHRSCLGTGGCRKLLRRLKALHTTSSASTRPLLPWHLPRWCRRTSTPPAASSKKALQQQTPAPGDATAAPSQPDSPILTPEMPWAESLLRSVVPQGPDSRTVDAIWEFMVDFPTKQDSQAIGHLYSYCAL